MKHRIRKKPAVVIYNINARCLDLEEFSGFFSRRKRKKLYESVMVEISDRVLDLFDDVETFTFALIDDGFRILIWAGRDRNRVSRVMCYVQSRFSEMVNRHLDRVGPVWDGSWTYDIINEGEE